MQTVPSLVGTGIAVAAAASGLVFGQPTEPTSPSSRRELHQRRSSVDHDQPTFPRLSSLPVSQPDTGSAAPSTAPEEPSFHTLPRAPSTVSRPPLSRYQRPQTSQITPPKVTSRRRSFGRQADIPASTITEASRDSISSNGSWMRRLSIRPLSQHGSSRSSIGPTSPSITFSHGSAAPILSPADFAASPLPPNKLVKRTPSTQANDSGTTAHRRSRSHLPSLRRPATSHQRSATLQQFNPGLDVSSPASPRRLSFDRDLPQDISGLSSIEHTQGSGLKQKWTSFFHSKTTHLGGRVASSRLSELSPHARNAAPRRVVCLGIDEQSRAHLVKPHVVSTASAPAELLPPVNIEEGDDGEEEAGGPTGEAEDPGLSPKETTPKRVRRSISMTFSSANNWVSSRASGSIRRPKRGGETRGGNKRHVSDPAGGPQSAAGSDASPAPIPLATDQGSALDSAASGAHAQPWSRKRNASSPIPPLSRLSTFHVDLPRLGSSGGAASHPPRSNQPSGSSASSTAMSQLRATHNQRSSSIMDGSEADAREFASGDDDDTDFKSDTLFDSIRTGASGRVRAVETPLDSMYDESPPSTAGNGKTKRLSIQEILGRAWDGDTKITEEDESVSTPVRATHFSHATAVQNSNPSNEARPALDASPFPANDFGRLSLDDDLDDDDWARDDDAPCNSLSPPSKESSLNSKGINPNVRLALASISGNGLQDSNHGDTHSERPLSHLFDWSESSVHDRQDADGHSPRPKTAYAKQEMDSRGGRSAIRKGPTPTHVRSQSVPVVHEVSDDAKPTGSKYGTWGIGTKTVSEDWDEDFEFGGGSTGGGAKSNSDLFAVPESIRATQPSVKAHSGQIRELSLLVNDLKRLCRHARELDMLNGQQKALWEEAEGVIALASPDEDDPLEDHDSSSSVDFDAFDADERYANDSLDGPSKDRPRADAGEREPSHGGMHGRVSPRRRSVFSPEDDIFGGNEPVGEERAALDQPPRPLTPENRPSKTNNVTGVVRTMMDAMHHRSIHHPARKTGKGNNRMHFDTNSLKALVKRAGDLRDLLSDTIRKADQIGQSPARTPRHERHVDSSPAFTRVFDDPGSSPPRRVVKSRGNNSVVDKTSPENSPSTAMNRRMQMMTVN